MKIETVTVIGANGTLGVGVSAIFTSFGDAKVNMVSRSMDKSNKAINNAAKSVKANSVMANMIAKDYQDIEQCISNSDLIIETIVEDYKEKEKIHKIINKNMKKDAIASSVTSGISINKLASCYNEDNKKRFIGIHFFNPPYSMPLCELIASKYTDKNIEEEIGRYLTNDLKRKVIKIKDETGFLANRIGFQFINQAMQYAEKYKSQGGIDYIDAIIGLFTGRNMKPIYTADFVGLDVHKAIVDNIYQNTNDYMHETFKLPGYVDKLIKQEKLGMKVDEGLYRYSGKQVYDIETNTYRELKNYKIHFIDEVIENFKDGDYKEGIKIILTDNSNEAKICRDLLVNYIIYSINISMEVAEKITDCDIAMAEGFNWIPPFALLDIIGKQECIQIAKENLEIPSEKVNVVCNISEKSQYGYEKFLKAKR